MVLDVEASKLPLGVGDSHTVLQIGDASLCTRCNMCPEDTGAVAVCRPCESSQALKILLESSMNMVRPQSSCTPSGIILPWICGWSSNKPLAIFHKNRTVQIRRSVELNALYYITILTDRNRNVALTSTLEDPTLC
jgi:hypothetical protein